MAAALAYVFWHAFAAGGDAAAYEERLRAFHASLAAPPPPGMLAAAALALEDGVPWLSWRQDVYEDWYLVDGWAAVGELERAAVDARRRPSHDAVAGAAAQGAGAVYALRRGPAKVPAGGAALWLERPRGTSLEDLEESLSLADGGSLWQRCLALGPAPEIRLHGSYLAADPPAGAVHTRARLVAAA